MSAHFLLTASSRRIGLMEVMRMSDGEIETLFRRARWPATGGAPMCPRCNMPANGPDRRGRFSCKWCRRQFTLTSGTILHGRKLSLRQILVAVLLWAASVKGASALEMGRHLNLSYKTTFVLSHKYRFAVLSDYAGRKVGGDDQDVEVDGCYIGGHVRPANYRENRRDRRLARHRNRARRVVVAARERRRGGRTIVTVVRAEADALGFLREWVRKGSVVHADEAPSWNDVEASHRTLRINHEIAYSDGLACTNLAESFFARVRRLEYGQHHRISGAYLKRYAVEAAYREDHRRLSLFDTVVSILHLLLTTGSDPDFRAYWQRARRRRRDAAR